MDDIRLYAESGGVEEVPNILCGGV